MQLYCARAAAASRVATWGNRAVCGAAAHKPGRRGTLGYVTLTPGAHGSSPSADTLTVTHEVRDGVSVLSVAGAIDLATTPALADAIDSHDAQQPLVVDLTAVSFLASSGMALLVATHKKLARAGFAVVADGPATSRPLSLTGLDAVFSLHSTLDAAVAGLR